MRCSTICPGWTKRPAPGNSPPQYADVVAKAVARLAVDVRAEFYRRHPDLDTIAATRSVQGFRLYVTHLIELLLADLGVQRAERQRHQRRAKIFTEVETGLWGLSGRWDPLTGQTLNTAITAEVNAIYHARRGDNTDLRTREQITADAITNLICNTPVSTRTSVAGVTAIVLTRSPDCRQRTPRQLGARVRGWHPDRLPHPPTGARRSDDDDRRSRGQ